MTQGPEGPVHQLCLLSGGITGSKAGIGGAEGLQAKAVHPQARRNFTT